MKKENAHYVAVTGIVIKDGKFLITKRSPNEKAFPNMWTVPGGKLNLDDYIKRQKDTSDAWYNVLEDLLRREINEETGKIDKKGLLYRKSDFHKRLHVNILSGRQVVKVAPNHQKVECDDGSTFDYDKLLIATGGSSKIPNNIPRGIDGISVLRTIADAENIKRKIYQVPIALLRT